MNELTQLDLTEIAAALYPQIPTEVMNKMIAFNTAVASLGAIQGALSL